MAWRGHCRPVVPVLILAGSTCQSPLSCVPQFPSLPTQSHKGRSGVQNAWNSAKALYNVSVSLDDWPLSPDAEHVNHLETFLAKTIKRTIYPSGFYGFVFEIGLGINPG